MSSSANSEHALVSAHDPSFPLSRAYGGDAALQSLARSLVDRRALSYIPRDEDINMIVRGDRSTCFKLSDPCDRFIHGLVKGIAAIMLCAAHNHSPAQNRRVGLPRTIPAIFMRQGLRGSKIPVLHLALAGNMIAGLEFNSPKEVRAAVATYQGIGRGLIVRLLKAIIHSVELGENSCANWGAIWDIPWVEFLMRVSPGNVPSSPTTTSSGVVMVEDDVAPNGMGPVRDYVILSPLRLPAGIMTNALQLHNLEGNHQRMSRVSAISEPYSPWYPDMDGPDVIPADEVPYLLSYFSKVLVYARKSSYQGWGGYVVE
ncbi:hypothetical protein C8J56DRAFT_900131 [Mycena floridula]|nr:hypothetical protein C8J56DRAFT_900131 [Mycena floridula]